MSTTSLDISDTRNRFQQYCRALFYVSVVDLKAKIFDCGLKWHFYDY